MARSDLLALIRHAGDTHAGEPDAVLLSRYADARDEPAFAELVRRYARLVWGQCRNLLPSEADADDAFQATFLVLAKSAKSIRDTDRLGPWLHAVAYKVCLNARRAATRRKKRERATAVPEGSRPVADSTWDVAAAAVYEEVSRLPDTLRVPFVLCHLEGKAPTAAAEQLGLPWGTFSSRLSRAKQRLLDRLSARGIGAAVAVAAFGGGVLASAVVIDRAIGYCSNPASVSASVLSLGSGVGVMSRAKLLAVVLLASVGVATVFLPGGGKPTLPLAHAAPVPKDEEGKKKALEAAWADLASTDDLVASRALLTLRDGATVAFFADRLKPLKLSEERAKQLLAELGSEKEDTWRAAYEELSYLDLRLTMDVFDVVKDVKGQEHQERLVALLRGFPLSKADALRWCKIVFEPKKAPQMPGQPTALFVFLLNHANKPAEFKTALDLLNTTSMSYALASDPKTLSDVLIAPLSWRRAVRAMALLEHFGTDPAKKILDGMATGHADASPTIAAKEALGRLKK